MLKLNVVNKAVSERERAESKGELTVTNINGKIIESGYLLLFPYEQDFIKETIAASKGMKPAQITDAEILDYCREVKKEYFKQLCEERIEAGFVASNGHFYRTNRDDQTNMIGQKDELTENESILMVPWKTEDVGYINHTREEWLTIYAEAFDHKKAQLFKYDNLRGKVLAAQTHDELKLIQWDPPAIDPTP